MSNYKLTYFNIRGLAETSRLIFAAAGQKYEDERFSFTRNADGSFARPEFEAAKAAGRFKWGKVPVLEVDGHQIAQSKAIERFLARRLGLYGSNDIEQADIDSVCEQLIDVSQGFYGAMGKDDAIKAAYPAHEFKEGESHKEKFWNTGFPDLMAAFSKVLGSNQYFVGNKLSLADIHFFAILNMVSLRDDNCRAALNSVFTKYPNLKELYDRIAGQEGVAKHIASRADTMF